MQRLLDELTDQELYFVRGTLVLCLISDGNSKWQRHKPTCCSIEQFKVPIATSLESMHIDMLIARPLIANQQCSRKASPNGCSTIQSLLAFTERGSTFQINIQNKRRIPYPCTSSYSAWVAMRPVHTSRCYVDKSQKCFLNENKCM